MKLTANKRNGLILLIATALTTMGVAATFISGGILSLVRSDTEPYNILLNNNNAPTLSGGEGTMVDAKGVTWEYHNASNSASGHVVLGADSYVGVSPNSNFGITAINTITANFTANQSSEGLWLLKSTDGVEWHEAEILTSGQATSAANNWRYVRFYNYQSTINIASISISYTCSGVSATEDVDSAHLVNVITTDGLTPASEYTDVSPRSVGGEAVRFTKDGTSSTSLTISFNKSYTLKDVTHQKVEFDIWTGNINYGKTIEVLNSDGTYTSSKFTATSGLHIQNPLDAYVWTSLGNGWYHAELPCTVLYTDISGYNGNDLPSTGNAKKQFNAIRINAGSCVIDNLRVGSSACELGNYNNPTYKPVVNEVLWVKTSWVGIIYSEECTITFDDDTKAEHIPPTDPNLENGSPFYVRILKSGTVTVTVNVVCGYNHRSQTITKTVTTK